MLLRDTALADHLDPSWLAQQMRDSGLVGIGLYLVTFSIGELMAIPATVFFATAVGVYGFMPGGLLACFGAAVACTFSFAVARATGRWILEKRSPGVFARYAPYIESQPIRAIIVLRLLYGASPPVNWLLALADIRPREFVIGTVGGLVPNALVYAWLIDQIAFHDAPEFPRWAAGLVLVAIMVISAILHRYMMRKFSDSPVETPPAS